MLRRALATALLLTSCQLTLAHEYDLGKLHIDHPWSRELPPNAPAGVAFFDIQNKGAEDRLLSVSTPAAAKAELHTHVQIGGMMRMEKLDSAAVPAQGELKFYPGGHHVMLFGLKKPLKAGDHFPLTLNFEKAGSIEVDVQVSQDAPAAKAPQHQGH